MIYLASPYSHPERHVEVARFKSARQCAAHLTFIRGLDVFSPIVYGHELAVAFDLPTSASVWHRFNTSMLRLATEMYVLKIGGWDTSLGVAEELSQARSLYVPIRYVDELGEIIL